MLFSTDLEVTVGQRIDLAVDLGDGLGLGLIDFRGSGQVVRVDDGLVAVKLTQGGLPPRAVSDDLSSESDPGAVASSQPKALSLRPSSPAAPEPPDTGRTPSGPSPMKHRSEGASAGKKMVASSQAMAAGECPDRLMLFSLQEDARRAGEQFRDLLRVELGVTVFDQHFGADETVDVLDLLKHVNLNHEAAGDHATPARITVETVAGARHTLAAERAYWGRHEAGEPVELAQALREAREQWRKKAAGSRG